jgi:diacylglycerol kinase family enzyme
MHVAPADMDARIPAFVNPASGGADAARAALGADARFEVREVAAAALAAAVRTAASAGARRVLVSGGDGSVAQAAGALLGSETELAILPGGTLNHFARDLALPRDDLAACLELAATGAARAVDVGLVNGHVFVGTSSVGAYVSFVRARERLERWLGYRVASAVAAVRIWLGLHAFVVVMRDAAGERRYRTPLLFVGVGERELERRELGARAPDGPRALHVLVVRQSTRARMLARALVAAARGAEALARSGSLETRLVTAFTAEMRRPWGNVALDGELRRLRAPLDYELLADALRVVTPPVPAAAEAEGAAAKATT